MLKSHIIAHYVHTLWCIGTSAMAKVRFSSLSVALSVCLSVCLLATLRENDWTDFHEFFSVGGTWYKDQLGTFSGCSIQPMNTGILFHLFRRNPWLLAAMQKTVERIFMKWKRTDLTQGAIWDTFRMLWLTPLNPGLIYLFPGSVFACNIIEKQVNGFSWNFYANVRHDTRNI